MWHCSKTLVVVTAMFWTVAIPISGGEILNHELVIPAPVADVWAAFTTKKGLESWLAPNADIELRIGGVLRTHHDGEGKLGDPGMVTSTVLAYEPYRMLSWRFRKAPADFSHSEALAETWSVALFDKVDSRSTRVRIVGLGYGTDEKGQAAQVYFKDSNARSLAQLKRHFVEANKSAKKSTVQKEGSEGATPGEPDEAINRDPQAIHERVTVEASVERVWQQWSTDEGVREFLAVDSMVDLTIGGPFEIYFTVNGRDGERGTEGCSILTYVPRELLCFSYRAPANFPSAHENHTWVVVHFSEPKEGHTTVDLAHLGWAENKAAYPGDVDEFDCVAEHVGRIWERTLKSFQGIFAKAMKKSDKNEDAAE